YSSYTLSLHDALPISREAGAQLGREHRDRARGQVDAGRARHGLGLERGARPDVVRDVGDGDDDAHAALLRGLGVERVVVVARVGRVDRDEIEVAEVDAAALLGRRDALAVGAGLGEGLLGEFFDDVLADLDLLGLDLGDAADAEDVDDAHGRVVISVLREAHELGDHRLVLAEALGERPLDPHRGAEADVVGLEDGLTSVEDDLARDAGGAAFEDGDDLTLAPLLGGAVFDLDLVAVERGADARMRDEDVGAAVGGRDEAEAPRGHREAAGEARTRHGAALDVTGHGAALELAREDGRGGAAIVAGLVATRASVEVALALGGAPIEVAGLLREGRSVDEAISAPGHFTDEAVVTEIVEGVD